MVRYSQSNRCIKLGSVYEHAPQTLPSPCMAFSQSLSVNNIHFGDVSKANGQETHFCLDHVTRNALAAWNNEAKGLGNMKHIT